MLNLINGKSLRFGDCSRFKINLLSKLLIHLCHLHNFYMHSDDNFLMKVTPVTFHQK